MVESSDKLIVNIRELSEITGFSIGTLYQWVSQKRIPHFKLSQRCLRFSVPTIREWLAEFYIAGDEPTIRQGKRYQRSKSSVRPP